MLKEACSLAYPESAICVQRFDDSLNSAIRITYRISLRSSSLREPRYPLLRVVLLFRNEISSPFNGSMKKISSKIQKVRLVNYAILRVDIVCAFFGIHVFCLSLELTYLLRIIRSIRPKSDPVLLTTYGTYSVHLICLRGRDPQNYNLVCNVSSLQQQSPRTLPEEQNDRLGHTCSRFSERAVLHFFSSRGQYLIDRFRILAQIDFT
jgi:hypothetical protein